MSGVSPVWTAYIQERLQSCGFFDSEVQTSMFFLTVHDATLHVQEKQQDQGKDKLVSGQTNLILTELIST